MLEADIEVEEEQDQLVQQLKRVIRWDEHGPEGELLQRPIGGGFMYSFGSGGFGADELKPEFKMLRRPERDGEDEDVRDLEAEGIRGRV